MGAAADRSGQLAARLTAHALTGDDAQLADIDVLRLGFQDAGPGTAMASLSLRVGGYDEVRRAYADGELATALTLRGAPHVHRKSDLPDLRAALAPVSSEDLTAVVGDAPAAIGQREDAVAEVAEALQQVMEGHDQLSKGALSEGLTPLLDADLTSYCQRCGARHVLDGLFRLATLRAWLVLVPEEKTQTFTWFGRRRSLAIPEAAPRERESLAAAAATVAVTADPGQIAAWLGVAPASIDVTSSDSSSSSSEASSRLLPARDPWLRGSDRAWLLGSHLDRRSDVFKALGPPGVVLVDGEIQGTWRQRKSGRTVVMALDPWTRLTKSQRASLERDAEIIAQSRGLAPEVSYG